MKPRHANKRAKHRSGWGITLFTVGLIGLAVAITPDAPEPKEVDLSGVFIAVTPEPGRIGGAPAPRPDPDDPTEEIIQATPSATSSPAEIMAEESTESLPEPSPAETESPSPTVTLSPEPMVPTEEETPPGTTQSNPVTYVSVTNPRPPKLNP